MRVKSRHSNKFLIKDEWYQAEMCEYNSDRININSYKLVNHTDKVWSNSWFSAVNFYTEREIRRAENLERLEI
jgi:hypothetical protein